MRLVNGQPHELPDGSVLTDLVAAVEADPRGIAVALNGSVVRAAEWPATSLREGDLVEVVTAHQGGGCCEGRGPGACPAVARHRRPRSRVAGSQVRRWPRTWVQYCRVRTSTRVQRSSSTGLVLADIDVKPGTVGHLP
jgi:sulfur carrier protein